MISLRHFSIFSRHHIKAMLLAALLAALCGCADQTGKVMQRAEDALFAEKPDSTLAILQSVDSHQIKSEGERARYALYLTAAEYFAGAAEISDSLLTVDAVPYFDKRGGKRDRMLCLFLSGVFDTERSNYQQAVVSLLRAAQIAEKLKDYFYLGRIYQGIADIYVDALNPRMALKYTELSHSNFVKSGNAQYMAWSAYDLARVNADAGYTQRGMALVDSCLNVEYIKEEPYLAQECLFLKATLLYREGNYRKAIDILRRGDCPEDRSNLGNFYLASAYVALGEKDSAEYYSSKITGDGISHNYSQYLIEKNKGDFAAALAELERVYKTQNDSILVTFGKNIAGGETLFYQNSAAVQRLKSERLGLLLAIVVMLFLVGLGLMLYRQRKRRLRMLHEITTISMAADQMQENLNARILENEVKLKDIELKLVRQETRAKEASIEAEEKLKEATYAAAALRARLREQQSRQRALQNTFEDISHISHMIYDVNITKRNKEKLYTQVCSIIERYRNSAEFVTILEDEVNVNHNNVVALMKHELPEVYEKYHRIFLYILAGLDSRTIPILLNVQPKTFFNYKSAMVKLIRESATTSGTYIASLIEEVWKSSGKPV